MQFRDLHRQYDAMRAEMDEALLKAAHSGAYIMGPQVAELEQQLADYVGVKHCITCANGTDALRLALMALNIGPGDAVFVPDFTFFATAEAVAMVGATPIFVDVNKDTYNIDVDDLNEKYYDTLETDLLPKAVMVVDLFGQPADYERLFEFCRGTALDLIEDGAQGFGVEISPPPRSSRPSRWAATVMAAPSSPTTTSGPRDCARCVYMARTQINMTTCDWASTRALIPFRLRYCG